MPLEAIGSAFPGICETAEDIAAQTGGDLAFIQGKVGVRRRYVLGPDETGVSLATHACRRLFGKASLSPDDVGLLVFVTQNPDRRMPQNSAMLAAALDLPPAVAAFDLNLGCSGYVYGLAVCEAFLRATGREHALLVTCDPYSRIMAAEDLATNAVFGDAATATWVSASGSGATIGQFDFGTDGAGGEALRIDAGGAVRPLVALGGEGVASGDRDSHRLRMDGRAVFNFVMERVPDSIERCLALNGIERDDVDAFALHQGSAFMLQSMARRARLPPEKLLMNIGDYGNTVSSTIPLLLEQYIDSGQAPARTVLISGFGVGLSWATSILKFGTQ